MAGAGRVATARFCFLLNDEKQAPWQWGYETLYADELRRRNHEVRDVGLSDLAKLGPSDILWVMHYNDFLAPEVRRCEARVIAQANGTATNPYCYQVDGTAERQAIEQTIDVNLVFSARMAGVMQARFPRARFLPVGFPVTVPPLDKLTTVAHKVVVAGRVGPDKQFLLATFLLRDIARDHEIVFCYPDDKGDEQTHWLEVYKAERFPCRVKRCDRPEYLAELATAEFYFSCSLGDISSVGLAEALLVGCYPVVPRFEEGLPCYDEHVSLGYAPFCKAEVEALVRDKPHFTWATGLSDPLTCTTRLLVGLGLPLEGRP